MDQKIVKEKVVEIIQNNQNLSQNELIWLPDIRNYNLPTSTILVLIEMVRKNKK
jgi:hypothetical protein